MELKYYIIKGGDYIGIGTILIHKISGTLVEASTCELGINLNFKFNLGSKMITSSTRYYTEDEVLKHWQFANEIEINSYKLGQ